MKKFGQGNTGRANLLKSHKNFHGAKVRVAYVISIQKTIRQNDLFSSNEAANHQVAP